MQLDQGTTQCETMCACVSVCTCFRRRALTQHREGVTFLLASGDKLTPQAGCAFVKPAVKFYNTHTT